MVTSPQAGPSRNGDDAGERTLGGVLGLTALAAALPGGSLWLLGRRILGPVVLFGFLAAIAGGIYLALEQRETVLKLLVQTDWLAAAIVVLALAFLLWAAVVVATDVLARPRGMSRRARIAATTFTAVLVLALAVPFAVGIRYAAAQRGFIDDVFVAGSESESATRPAHVTEEDPWAGRERVNILLLGGDGGQNREGVRTDSVMLASIDVDTGDTVLFGLPRNLEDVPFPVGTPLDRLYPYGFSGPGDPLEWMLNAVYPRVPELHPGVLGRTDNEGADALKLAVSGALGIPVDYYVLVSIPGFVDLVDAMGGVTVNINHPVPIGGIEGVLAPEDYLDPGPNQHLDGFEAMWFARGRYGLDDYDRMRRQRCLVDAVIERADPVVLLTRYEQILDAGRDILRTDIPAELLPALVDLAFEVKEARIRSVVFSRSDRFEPGAPDFDWMQDVVARATGAAAPQGGSGSHQPNRPRRSIIASPANACTYQPDA